MMQNKTPQSGFSLVETLVAITILLIVIVGPLAIVSSAARSTMFASDQVTAFLLAQEGAELAQKARDDLVIAWFNNSSAPDPWTTFTDISNSGTFRSCFPDASGSAPGCGLEIDTDAAGSIIVQACDNSNPTVCQLHFDSDSAERARFTYTSSGNVFSGFTRVVKFQSISANEVRVVSEVTWFSGVSRNARKVEVETYLFNIYD